MRTYKKIFKITLLEELQYKTTYISGVICQIAFGFIYIFLYSAFFESGVPQDFSMQQMVNYAWLGQAFFAMFCYSDNCKSKITKDIVNGNVSYQLIKPLNIYTYWFGYVWFTSASKALVRCVPLLIVACLIPKPYGMTLPASLPAFLLFLIALLLGSILISAIKMIAYWMVLQTLNPYGVFSILYSVFAFLGGGVVPIPMLPAKVQNVINFFPCRYASDLPFRLYIGNINWSTGLIQIGIQLLWIVGLVIVMKALIDNKCKKLCIQGG